MNDQQMQEANAAAIAVNRYIDDRDNGSLRLVKVHGNVLLARKGFNSITGEQVGLTATVNVPMYEAQVVELKKLLENMQSLIDDAKAAKEVAD